MSKTKIFLISLLTVCISLFFFSVTVNAATLTLSPDSGDYDHNDTFTVEILIDTKNEDTDGVDIYSLNYDPALLQAQDADASQNGIQVEIGDAYNLTVFNAVDTSQGTIQLSRLANPGTFYNGSGVLARVTFKVITQNKTQATLTFDYTQGNTVDTNIIQNGIDILTSVSQATFDLSSGGQLPPQEYGTVSTKITQDSLAGSALVGAKLVLNPGYHIGTTDANGVYEWSALVPGTYALTASMADYQSYTKKNIVVTISQTAQANIYLTQKQIKADELAGKLVKSPEHTAVYYIGKDSKRYVFSNEKTYKTWYTDFNQVITITKEKLASYLIGGNATYRPGTRLIKIMSDPRVYAVEPGGVLREVPSEAAALALFGQDWSKKIDDLSDAFFTNYQMGQPLSVDKYSAGSLIRYPDSSDIYYLDQSYQKRKFTSNQVFNDNWFESQYILNVPVNISFSNGPDITTVEDGLITLAGG